MKRSTKFILAAGGSVAVLALLTGCGRFERNWRHAASPPANDISGPWIGTWKSDSNGHTDKLRCLIEKVDADHYNAKFKANYRRKLLRLSFGYTVPLVVTNQGSDRQFKGEADLGKLAGGKYTYAGDATPQQFHSRYDSKYDHGTFELHRP